MRSLKVVGVGVVILISVFAFVLPAEAQVVDIGVTGEVGTVNGNVKLKQGNNIDMIVDSPNDTIEIKAEARRTATKIVAASDSLDKTKADYVCDGVNDDVEIQAAINALPSMGGEVVLLEGNFSIGAKINVNAPGNIVDPFRPTVKIRGQGISATRLKMAQWVNTYMFETAQPPTELIFIMEDLALDGNRANQTAGGVLHVRARYNYLNRLHVFNGYDAGIRSEGGGGQSTTTRANHIMCGGNGTALLLITTVDSWFVACDFGNSASNYMVNLMSGGTILFDSCYIWGSANGWSGLVTTGDIENVQIINCRFDSNRAHDIDIRAGISNWQITNNEFRGLHTDVMDGAYNAINLNGTDVDLNTDIEIIGNRFINVTSRRYGTCIGRVNANGENYIIGALNNGRGGYATAFHNLTGANDVIVNNIQ